MLWIDVGFSYSNSATAESHHTHPIKTHPMAPPSSSASRLPPSPLRPALKQVAHCFSTCANGARYPPTLRCSNQRFPAAHLSQPPNPPPHPAGER
jgi:hypothetical protein